MKKLLLGSLLVLASLNTFAQAGNLDGVKCSVPTLKAQHEDVKFEMRLMMIEMKVDVARKLARLGLQFNPDEIKITKKETGFMNNYATKISGRAETLDGAVLKIYGEIQYGQAMYGRRYDRLGNDLGKYCAFRAFANVSLRNSQNDRHVAELNIRPVQLDLLKN